ncbi:MAG: ribosome recycling factor [Candidatus Aminicenantes bacterium]|nr:ribosome recycling factor [Candidatus Aminicenantes bacterium]
MLKETIDEIKEKLDKIVVDFRKEISKFRTGRASVSILDGITVNYYGVQTPINQTATVSLMDANLIVIQPWDPAMINEIEKVIRSSNLEINPVSDGKVIRLPVPPLDEQRRLDIVKILKRYTEERKTTIRNIRREYREFAKDLKDEGDISEDDEKRFYDDLQGIIDEKIDILDKTAREKEKHIMED